MSRASERENGKTSAAAAFPALCADIAAHLEQYAYRLPSELGTIKPSQSKGLDVLVLSTFSLWGDPLNEVWQACDDASLALWPFYCASKDRNGTCVAGPAPAKSSAVPGCDWLEWARAAVNALAPKLVVVLTWEGKADRNFAPLWGKKRVRNLPAAADVIEIIHPKDGVGAFRERWAAEVAVALRERFLVGAKRNADGTVDALRALKVQRLCDGKDTERLRAARVLEAPERVLEAPKPEPTPRPSAESRAEEMQARDQDVMGHVSGEGYITEDGVEHPYVWTIAGSAEDAQESFERATAVRKAKLKADAAAARIARNLSGGQQQVSRFFASGGPRAPDAPKRETHPPQVSKGKYEAD